MKDPKLLETMKVYKGQDDVPADFDAFYIQKNKKASVLDKAVINVALSAAKAQSIAYVFGREAQNAYQLLNASPVSEIGTVTIQADTNQEYLILY